MLSPEIIAIIVIGIIVIIAIGYYFGREVHLNRILEAIIENNYTSAMILLDKADKITTSSLNKKEIEKLLSFPQKDWLEWKMILPRVLGLADKYPNAFSVFIEKYIPQAKKREYFKKRHSILDPLKKNNQDAIISMRLDELRLIDSESEESWKKRENLNQLAKEIRRKYPEGYETYCNIHYVSNPEDSQIVQDKNTIIELQTAYINSIKYTDWEKRQEKFVNDIYYKLLAKLLPDNGRYYYMVPFKKPNRKGLLKDSEFEIWQGFDKSFSSHLLERQTESYLSNYNHIPSFEHQERYFVTRVYDDICGFIESLEKEVEGELYVLFIDRCKRKWSKETYNYHYNYIRSLLDNKDITHYNFSELSIIKDDSKIGAILIFDFITSNDELKKNSRMIIEHFNKSVPYLAYYSMVKEYDENELLKTKKFLKPENIEYEEL